MAHYPGCQWQRTTTAECEYRTTHHYCPHPAHACSCPTERRPAWEDVKRALGEEARRCANTHGSSVYMDEGSAQRSFERYNLILCTNCELEHLRKIYDSTHSILKEKGV